MAKQKPSSNKKYGPPWKITPEPKEESYFSKRMTGLVGSKSGIPANADLDKSKMKPKVPTSIKASEPKMEKRPATTPKSGGVATTRKGNIKKKK